MPFELGFGLSLLSLFLVDEGKVVVVHRGRCNNKAYAGELN